MTTAHDIAAAIRRQIPPERLAAVIAELPLAERVELKRLFEPRPAKSTIRIRR